MILQNFWYVASSHWCSVSLSVNLHIAGRELQLSFYVFCFVDHTNKVC
jgi:hypothetical protein